MNALVTGGAGFEVAKLPVATMETEVLGMQSVASAAVARRVERRAGAASRRSSGVRGAAPLRGQHQAPAPDGL